MMFSCEFREIFKGNFFIELFPEAPNGGVL